MTNVGLRDADLLQPTLRSAIDLSPNEHLLMQAALQPFVDNAISKPINVDWECLFDDLREVYDAAYDLGLKGCTTFHAFAARAANLRPGMKGPRLLTAV